MKQVEARLEQANGAFGTSGGAYGTEPGRVWNALSSINLLKAPIKNLLQHLQKISTEKNTGDSETQKLVVGEIPDNWDLNSLLSTSQLHPGTRKKLQEWEIESWILVSHMLYAHSRDASNVNSPMAVVGSALKNDHLSGFGGHYDVLAQLNPRVLSELVGDAYNFAIQNPYEYYHGWKSGNRAWDMVMAQTDPQKLLWLAVRLGIANV